ncbi:MAG: DUF998 domain-containing protein [Armatimonadota bacterium]
MSTENITKSSARVSGASSGTTTTGASMLLTCGVVAGPLFIIVALIQAFTRSGFDPRRHPLSLLSLGDLGWIQIANFVVGGMLFFASAVGMRRALHPGPGRKWGPWLIGAFGVSLVAGGVFLADPAFGFPPGTPEGAPAQLSWHGIVHGVAPIVGFLSLIAACFVFARRFASRGQRGWAAYCTATGAVVLALSVWPSFSGDFVPLWVALVLGFGWPSVMAVRLMTGRPV